MALKLNRSNTSNSISTKIAGDLGEIQITEDSDCENGKISEKKVSRTLTTKSTIPSNLIQNTVPMLGTVTVTNSDNVQFGNNTYFNGPVTIKQVIQNKSGVDNAAYTNTEEDVDSNAQKLQKGKIDDGLTKKEQILLWHKITFSAVCITVIGSVIAIVLVLQNKGDQQRRSDPQTDFQTPDSSADTTVVGYCFESFQAILILIILLPLIMTILYSLLTKKSVGDGVVAVVAKNEIHDNCLNKFCKQCNKKDPLLIAPDHLRIVSRTDWLAQPVEKPLTKLKLPAPWVIITHTATESCYTQSQCVLRVRLIQSFHVESRGWYDIGYNFLVGGDGSIYYGRGWDYEGAHTKGYNKYSIGIAFIGTFNNDPPPKQQVEACQKIIKQGVQLNKLAKDYKLFAHRQLMSTLSPGDEVYNIIKTWPHFVSNFTDTASLIPTS